MKKRNRLHPSLFEAMQILKFSYKKERLNFLEDWNTQEKHLIPPNEMRGLPKSGGDDIEVAIDRVLQEMMTQDQLEEDQGS